MAKKSNNDDFLKKNATGYKSVTGVSGPKPMEHAISFSKKNSDGASYRGNTLIQSSMANPFKASVSDGKLIAKNMGQTKMQGNKADYASNKGMSKSENFVLIEVPSKAESKIDIDHSYGDWDGLSPLNTYSSSKFGPNDMIKYVKQAFENLVENGDCDIDYDHYSAYIFEGRAYTLTGELEFRVNIFGRGKMSDKSTKCEIEVRRMSGDCFVFGDTESKIVDELLKQNVIDEDQGSQIGKLELNSFQNIGFSVLPLPLKLDDLTDSDDTVNEEQFTKEDATQLIQDAIDKSTYQDEYSLSVSELYDAVMDENKIKVIINSNSNIINILLNSIKKDNYDAFCIKTVLDVVNILQKNGAKIDDKFKPAVKAIYNTWSKTVKNIIGKTEFKFPKSQTIMNRCFSLLKN